MNETKILDDETVQRILAMVPPVRWIGSGPRATRDLRLIVQGIAFRILTGCGWRKIPKEFGSWGTTFSRYRQWRLAGVAEQVEREIQRALSEGRLIR